MTAEAALFVRDQVSEKLPSERVRIVHEACRRCMEEGESVVTIDHVKAALDA